MRRRTAVIAALAAGTVIVPLPVWAYWSLNSDTTGATQASALAAPTIAVAMNGSAARISVTAAPATGVTPTSYRVDRTAPGSTVTGVCTISGSTGSCQDASPVPLVVNTYKVVGIYSTWTAIGTNAPSANVTPPALNTAFTITAPANATAGTSFPITITATATSAGATVTDLSYTGSHTFTLTGPANSPGGTAPTLPTTATFSNGVATVNVTLVAAGSTTLTITEGSRTGSSSAITVTSGTAAKVGWTGVTAPVGTVSQTDATTYKVIGAGNNGVAVGSLQLLDALGNPATNVGAGWTLVLSATSDRSGDVGAFKVGSTNGTNGQPLTVTFPATGAAALSFTYTHNGNADWNDVITVTAAKNAVPTTPSLTINLQKN